MQPATRRQATVAGLIRHLDADGTEQVVEMRLPNAQRTGEVTLRGGQDEEAARLLGADGLDPAARPGLARPPRRRGRRARTPRHRPAL